MVETGRSATNRTCDMAGLPYFLTPDLAERHGVDLGGAVHGGLLTLEDFVALLSQCRDCQDGAGRRHDHPEGAQTAPDWCANRAVLEGLRGMV